MIREIPWRVHQESEKERKKREDRVSEKGIINGGEYVDRKKRDKYVDRESERGTGEQTWKIHTDTK